MSDDWIDRFQGLSQLPADLRRQLTQGSQLVALTQGTQVFAPGAPAHNLLLLLQGTVRVQQVSDSGREVVLYRVNAGESCVLTTACMLSFDTYAAEGIAETDVRAVAIPRATFDRLVADSPVFREFVFTAYSRRITDLFSLIDDIVFQRMDVRLASRLLDLAGDSDHIRATHATLATELGTAREVVSRTLAEFHRRGWVDQERGKVILTAKAALTQFTRS